MVPLEERGCLQNFTQRILKSDHKWNFCERVVDVVHKRFDHLLETLDSFVKTGKPDEKSDAHGLLRAWRTAQNVCILVIFPDDFCQLGPLSNVLQAKNCNLAEDVQLASSHTIVLNEKRNSIY